MIRTTLIGGIFFLIPLVFLSFLLGKAFVLTSAIAQPIEDYIPFDDVGGIGVRSILAVAILIALCTLAGLVARLSIISRRVQAIDALMLDMAPGYAVLKTTVGGLTTPDDHAQALNVVHVRFDDHELLAFEVERGIGESGVEKVIVFLPGAPSAWSGNSVIVHADRVTPLPLTVSQAVRLLRVLGRGSGPILARNAELLSQGKPLPQD